MRRGKPPQILNKIPPKTPPIPAAAVTFPKTSALPPERAKIMGLYKALPISLAMANREKAMTMATKLGLTAI